MRRARERVPEHVSQGLNRAGEMARDVRVRAKTAAFTARERARDFDASELGLHYDFLVKAHGLRKRYAETLRRAPDLGDSGRAFLARLELEKRSERLRLGTAKLRRRARLELVRFLSVLIAALERLRDRLADAPPQPAANTNLLTSQFSRLFLPPPSPREAGADFPGGLRAQARSWARGWGRPAQRMRNVTPEPEEEEETVAAEPPPEAETAHSPESEPAASDAGRTERSASSEDPERDPTTDAVRRVRRLFGIRDRARGPKSDRKYSGGAGRANGKAEGADRAERAHFGNERHDAAADGERAEKSRRSESAKAQILPPLRGSRAGVYDASSGNARKRDSLRSRLSTMGDDQANEAEPEDQDAHKASAERKEKAAGGRWRRWFGL